MSSGVTPEEPLGLIAGNRSLPFLFAREARRSGRRVVAIGFEGETDPGLAAEVDEMIWIRVGQLSRMIEAFQSYQVRECVMLGQIAPSNLFDLRPDLRAMSLLWRLKEKNAHTVFGAIGEELAKDGIQLIPAIPWLRDWMPGEGYLVGKPLGNEEASDVNYAWRIAKEVARLEIGQSVVVKAGTTLAVEGFEGTDACLERGGRLAGKKGRAVAVKVAKAQHDLRFDLPTIGPRTLEICGAYGIRVLAVESGRTLMVDRPEMETWVDRLGLTLLTVEKAARDFST
jgi:DUF1009 family protein